MSDDEYVYSDVSESEAESEARENEEQEIVSTKRHNLPSVSRYARIDDVGYKVLTKATLLQRQNLLIREVQEILNINMDETRRILIEYRWNKEGVMEDYLRLGLDELRKRSGIALAPTVQKSSTCTICFDDLCTNNSLTNVYCGHQFCRDCWRRHSIVRINDGLSRRVPCMEVKCKSMVEPRVVQEALKDNPQVLAKYELSMLESFIEDNPRVKWCPSVPCCGNAVEVSESLLLRTDCECCCEEIFCFACFESSHTPVPCAWAREWRIKCEKESADAMYIAHNCKPCPNCHKSIIKDGGCLLVTCRCGQSMCWLCGQATGKVHTWEKIDGHECKKFRPNEGPNGTMLDKDLEIYVHHLTRYNTNMESLGKAKELETKAQEIADTLGNEKFAFRQGDWYPAGLKQLIRMRRYLAWTYPFAYFAFYKENGVKLKAAESKIKDAGAYHLQSIFEDLQNNLQQSTESLTRLLETKHTHVDDATRAQVLQLASSTNQLAVNLWKFVSEEILGKGLQSHLTPNLYFPNRRVAMAMGVKGVSEDAAEAASGIGGECMASEALTRHIEVIDLTNERNTRNQKRKRRA